MGVTAGYSPVLDSRETHVLGHSQILPDASISAGFVRAEAVSHTQGRPLTRAEIRRQQADRAHGRLIEGMIERTPGCRSIDKFTADYVTPDDREILAKVCASCPLRLLCSAYVDLDRPSIGFWAGRYYGPKTRPREHARTASPRKPRPQELPYDPRKIAAARARAASFRDAVDRGELDGWWLEAADELDSHAEAQELANSSPPN